MIEAFNGNKDLSDMLIAITENKDEDFYLTQDNQRVFINTIPSLKKLLKESKFIFNQKESGYVNGTILVWKSIGGTVARNYVKISAPSPSEAEKLLTVLLWNYKKPLYVKVKKNSPLETVYKSKGFRFEGGRGSQVLLKRDAIVLRPEKGRTFQRNASQVHPLRQEELNATNNK